MYSIGVKIFTALLYASTSLMITFSNKIVLTSYKFECFMTLGFVQLLVTFGLLNIARLFGLLRESPLNTGTFIKYMPFSIFYFGNLFFGLGSVNSISLPMFSCLRKLTIIMTMYGEFIFLKKDRPFNIKLSVYMIMAGGVIAAYYDLKFEWYGYCLVILNNIFTVGNGLYAKYTLNKDNNENEILYFSSMFSLIPMLGLTMSSNEIKKLMEFDKWNDPGFLFFLTLSCTIGFLLNYSIMVCYKCNSPLTTTIIGTLKNVIITYAGMFVGGDYVLTLLNFTGLTISSIGSLYYTYLEFYKKADEKPDNLKSITEHLNELKAPILVNDSKESPL